MRDEVLAEWQIDEGAPFLYVYVYVGQFGPIITAIRNTVFRRELPLALEAIIYGDNEFFKEHPQLYHAPIWIYFDSSNSEYNKSATIKFHAVLIILYKKGKILSKGDDICDIYEEFGLSFNNYRCNQLGADWFFQI